MNRLGKKSYGFTLVELIVVIIILGFLSVVALPRFLDAASESKVSAIETLAGAMLSTALLQHDVAIMNLSNGGFENGFVSEDGVLFDQGFPVAIDFDTPGSNLGSGDGVPEILEGMTLNVNGWTYNTNNNGSENGQATRELVITHRDVIDTGASVDEIKATNCYASYQSYINIQEEPVVRTVVTGC